MHYEHFEELSLNKHLLRALSDEGYTTPTPIQREAIPLVLAGGDLLATAQTGTGKTAAFALPILHMLNENPAKGKRAIRALILTPTRELALQIYACLRAYGRHMSLRSTVILGGVSSKAQISSLKGRPDILVATPGRLLDLYGQGFIKLDNIETFVLDEADRMLDMGFVHDVRKIVEKLPKKRQTLFFSATLSPEIESLAYGIVTAPSKVAVSPPSSVSDTIDQQVLFVEQMDKSDLLTGILKDDSVGRALVFARTKRQADRIMKNLTNNGIKADAIHSNKTQNARQKALAAFDMGRIKALVGTDIVARGIDVDGITHVINYELPNDPESYVHRIGRTARAGKSGTAITFCSSDQVSMLRSIEKLMNHPLTPMNDHPFHSGMSARIHERLSTPPPPPVAQPEFGRHRKERTRGRMGRASNH